MTTTTTTTTAALRKTASRAKSKLESKMKSVDGLEKILPSTFRKPAGGEQLILENHFVLYLSWTYYGGL